MVDSIKQTGGVGKGVASAFVPGLGQFCDGRNKEGAAYLGTSAAIALGANALGKSISKDMFQATQAATQNSGFDVSKYLKGLSKYKMWGALALGLAGTGVWIANIVDAYKGGKKQA